MISSAESFKVPSIELARFLLAIQKSKSKTKNEVHDLPLCRNKVHHRINRF